MSNKLSRQEQAFNLFMETFIKLIERDKGVPMKQDVLAWWHDFFQHEGVRNNMIQAFSNFMFDMDDRMEWSVSSELRTIADMIPKVADINDKNTQAIMHMMSKLISESDDKEITYQTPEELIAEVGLDEEDEEDEDNTPLV